MFLNDNYVDLIDILFTCQFESGFCGMSQNNGTKFWERRKGETPSLNTGPTQDHTSGKGKDVYNYCSDYQTQL